MKNLLKEAKKIQTEITQYRRYLHQNAEVGFDLPKTAEYVAEQLRSMGYTPKVVGRYALTAEIGRGSPVFLLRADMDGLPIKEQSGEPFACKYGYMHACGHDLHTAMLLGAAKLLKAREKDLKGKVKLLFQPAEEILEGAKNAVENGVLTHPKVDGAMMLHVLTGVPLPMGSVVVAQGVSAPAADFFTLEVQGKGCHGSTPWKGVDASAVGAKILLGLQEITAKEVSFTMPSVLSVGSISAGEAGNVIADKGVLKGTLRTFDEGARAYIKTRIEEIAKYTAKAFRAKAKVKFEGGCHSLLNDEKLSALALQTAKALLGESVFSSAEMGSNEEKGGSEDFAYISREVPSVMLALSAGNNKDGYKYPLHHPKVKFDENALYIGSALYTAIALQFLKNA
ncbi:MAG: amidohydrolase [Clostridia bacterium]|nr:amidohydrolase [Clostridia bacterium]